MPATLSRGRIMEEIRWQAGGQAGRREADRCSRCCRGRVSTVMTASMQADRQAGGGAAAEAAAVAEDMKTHIDGHEVVYIYIYIYISINIIY